MDRQDISIKIKAKAHALGFFLCGISRAQFLEDEAKKLDQWLGQNYHGDMSYMARHFDKRLDPTLLVPGAKSVISLAYNYFTDEEQSDPHAPKISKYAYGKDYHRVVKDKLWLLFEWIKEEYGDIQGRIFVDSAPVMERDWAKRSGLGWIGKHTLLIHPRKGSYFFLGEIICDLDMDTDAPIKDYCGTCTRCIDACPTDAIAREGYVLNAQRCISYLTIELRKNIPPAFKDSMDNWMFGCDICQDVCPWNKFSTIHNEPEFIPNNLLISMSKEEWLTLNEETYHILFNESAVSRVQFEGLQRNISFLYSDDNNK